MLNYIKCDIDSIKKAVEVFRDKEFEVDEFKCELKEKLKSMKPNTTMTMQPGNICRRHWSCFNFVMQRNRLFSLNTVLEICPEAVVDVPKLFFIISEHQEELSTIGYKLNDLVTTYKSLQHTRPVNEKDDVLLTIEYARFVGLMLAEDGDDCLNYWSQVWHVHQK